MTFHIEVRVVKCFSQFAAGVFEVCSTKAIKIQVGVMALVVRGFGELSMPRPMKTNQKNFLLADHRANESK